MNRTRLLRSDPADKAAGPAANIADERPGSCNHNLPGVKYTLELARALAAGPNSLSASAPAISTSLLSAQRLEGELLLLSVPPWVAYVSAGCWGPEVSMQGCLDDVHTCSCSEAPEARA